MRLTFNPSAVQMWRSGYECLGITRSATATAEQRHTLNQIHYATLDIKSTVDQVRTRLPEAIGEELAC